LIRQANESCAFEKECDIHFKKAQLDKKDENNFVLVKKSLKLTNEGVIDESETNNVIKKYGAYSRETYWLRHEKCLISDYNFYDDSFLHKEKMSYYALLKRQGYVFLLFSLHESIFNRNLDFK